MNLLLLLTALLTGLTGMMSGDRTGSARVPAAAIAAQAGGHVQTVRAAVAARMAPMRPATRLPALRETNVPLARAFVLVPALRLAAEKRLE